MNPRRLVSLVMLVAISATSSAYAADLQQPHWEPAGWGGGGWYWSAVFHPTRDGVIYLGQDTGGVSKTTDHGLHWRMVNVGLTNCGVYSLAVDRTNPDTVYAATEDGLCKSVDAGEHWQFLPRTGRKDLRITAERNVSVRAIAVDPSHGDNLYAASPGGKIYKSGDGGQNWVVAWESQGDADDDKVSTVQFGGVNGDRFAGAWFDLAMPAECQPDTCVGIGISLRGGTGKSEGSTASRYFVTVTTSAGVTYNSANIADLAQGEQWRDVVLKTADFTIDPGSATKFPDAAKAGLVWATVNRMDIACNGPMTPPQAIRLKRAFFACQGDADGKLVLRTAKEFTSGTRVGTYGNLRVAKNRPPSPVYAVDVAAKNPSLVVAATEDRGVVLSEDAGKTWRELATPRKASCAVFAASDPSIMYGCFFADRVWKSTDQGRTWTRCSDGIPDKSAPREIAVSPTDPLEVFCVGDGPGWISHDGGASWKQMEPLNVDLAGNPTRHYGGTNPMQPLGRSKNIAINPQNPKELYIAQDWRSCWSGDGGATWCERERGSDIVCNTDIRFTKGRVYASGMDVGALMSEDNGTNWRQLWPGKWIATESGHCWRMAIRTDDAGVDHIVTAFSPWDLKPKINLIIVSDDGGKSHQVVTQGLPDYMPTKNTMWETGFIRALAASPADPQVLYAGIDGDPEPGRTGGGLFRSRDGGHTWKQLPNQPGSRRMFNGLAVDPTDAMRLYWGACADGGGVWLSEDGGDTWKNVFNRDAWIWNILVAKDGRAYAGGGNLWRSDDHGRTWQQLTTFSGRKVQGLEVDPRDAKSFWISATSHDRLDGSGIYHTTDDGATWTDITGDCPSRQPCVLRFNPETDELWCGWVGLYKTRQ